MNYVRLRRTIFGLDIVGFERRSWSDIVRMELRAALHRVLDDALERSSGNLVDCDVLDRGDGVMMIFDSSVSPAVVLDVIGSRLATGVAQFNELAGREARMRLRAALHVGEVLRDRRGYIGGDLNLAFRLLDSPMLRSRLSEGEADLVVAVSEAARDELVANGVGLPGLADVDADLVRVKETAALAWLLTPRVPGGRMLGDLNV